MYQNATKSYEQVNYFTANPMKLVLMCYEGAIGNLKLAQESYLAKEYEAKGRALLKALDIIHELNSSLDMERGGEIAKNLRSLYTYMITTLVEADLKRNLTIFGKVIQMLEELEGEWKEVAGLNSPRPLPTPAEARQPSPRRAVAVGGSWSA